MRRTVSALPDCLASHYSGTLEELEVIVRTVEEARSLASASESLRTDIELPGALRYLRRVVTAVHAALLTLRVSDRRFGATHDRLIGATVSDRFRLDPGVIIRQFRRLLQPLFSGPLLPVS